jgi:Rod binding domain-containing protein
MDLSALSGSVPAAAAPSDAKPRTTEEAAEQFEAVFVRQFVQVMTKGLFDRSLAGDDALADGQADMQRDILTDTLTDHLVESGALRLSDLLLRQWSRGEGEAAASEVAAPAAPAPSDSASSDQTAPASSSFWESFGRGYTPPPGSEEIDAE